MFILTTQSSQKNNRIFQILLFISFAVLSIFPIYRNFYYSNGILTYERHRAVIERRSEYYNPWQYRILCPYTIEACLFIYNKTIDKIYPIENKINFNIQNTSGTTNETDQFLKLMQNPGALKYMIIFFLFRFLEHLLIFYLAWNLWSFFIKSKFLLFFGINFLALSMGNAVAVADLSFNTYMDIIFYLIAGNIILYKKNYLPLIPIIVLSAFNRETSILIPALFFISQIDFTGFKITNLKSIILPPRKIWIFTGILYLIFILIFLGLRIHFGYKPQQVWKAEAGWPMLKLNLFSAVGLKSFMELIGTFGVIPLIIIYKFKTYPHILKKWFFIVVPIWFTVHYLSVVAYQTRLFLVPLILIILPMLFWIIEKEIKLLANSE